MGGMCVCERCSCCVCAVKERDPERCNLVGSYESMSNPPRPPRTFSATFLNGMASGLEAPEPPLAAADARTLSSLNPNLHTQTHFGVSLE